MTREVLERDAGGQETVVVYRDTPEESARLRQEIKEQEQRGEEVARSFTRTVHDVARTDDSAPRSIWRGRSAHDSINTDDSVSR